MAGNSKCRVKFTYPKLLYCASKRLDADIVLKNIQAFSKQPAQSWKLIVVFSISYGIM